MIRLLIADDQALVRGGFRMILEAQPDLEVAGEAANGADAIDQARRLRPDVILMDIRMPGVDGIEATRRIVAEQSPPQVLMLTTFDQDEYVYQAMRAGASGFLLKDVAPGDLVNAVRSLVAGDALLAPAITCRLLERFLRRPPPSSGRPVELRDLTDREIEVLLQVARGLSNAEIGETLFVSEATVKTHVTRILSKLHLRDRVQAVVLAYETGLVEPGAPI